MKPKVHTPLLDALERFLAPEGEAWIADPGRPHVEAFCKLASARGWSVEARDAGGATSQGADGHPEPSLDAFRLLVLRRLESNP